jgi:uncharacterized cupredoxin-like copper-binding protein
MHRSLTALFCAATLAACSGNDAAKTDTTKVAQNGVAATATAMYDPATRTATVHAKDFAFVAPDSIPAGWTNFHLVNDGPALHHLQIVRLDSGKTASDFAAATKNPGPFPAWATFVGGPNAPNPSAESNGAVNLEPGNYLMICLVDIPDNVPHFAKGMLHTFTVTASTAAGTEPASDATIALADYSFTVTGSLTAGHHVVKVTNAGPQPHEVEIFRFAPGKGMKELAAWAAKPMGPPPGDAIGGVSALAGGKSASFTADLTPGNYVMLCFIPDTKDGKPHLEHGMVKEFAVK